MIDDNSPIARNCDFPVAKRPLVQDVLEAVADHYQISVKDLRGQSRKRRLAWPRQVACAVARDITSQSYPQIGRYIGDRDHTTILWARRKIYRLRSENSRLDALCHLIAARAEEMAASRPKPERAP